MTKVQRYFQLQRPIDDALMEQIAVVNSIYGIERVRVEPSGNLMVEYDATRLNVAQVEGVLERAGIAVSETAGALGSI
jgi:copper chaperone CopZ